MDDVLKLIRAAACYAIESSEEKLRPRCFVKHSQTHGATKNMKVYGFPRAQHDECFSSWYFRCLQVSNEDAQLLDIPKYAIEPDFWLTGQESLRYTYGSVNARTLMIFFREQSSWVLPWEQRRAYCHHCFCDDIKAGLIPYWRKRWCYLHCPICAKHTCQLEEFSDFSIGIDKSWAAFAGYCKSAEKSTSRALISRPPQRIIFGSASPIAVRARSQEKLFTFAR